MSAAAALRARTRTSYRFFQTYRTRWNDNDQYGHVNNSVYAFYVDSIVNGYLISHCSLRPTDATSPHIGLVVSSSCVYFRPLSFPENVELGLRVNKLGRSSVVYEVGFFKEGEDEVCAVGGFVHVFVDREGRRPVEALGEGMRRGLEGILAGEKAEL